MQTPSQVNMILNCQHENWKDDDENTCLFMQNIKLDTFNDGNKSIINNITNNNVNPSINTS
jgi:hypothetical protein